MNNSLYSTHAFVVRVWWEPGLTRLDGRPLWRGQVQHAASGQTLVFQSLDELLRFIQSHAGDLEPMSNDRMTNDQPPERIEEGKKMNTGTLTSGVSIHMIERGQK